MPNASEASVLKTPETSLRDERILPIDAEPQDRVLVRHQRQHLRQLAQVELVVGVGVEDQLAARRLEAVAQRGAVAEVHRMAHHA